MPALNTQRKAVLQALLVVFLWATSWVLIKIGLQDIPPLTFAALRYLLASVVLLIALSLSPARRELGQIKALRWAQLCLLGLLLYAATQGAMFVALAHLPAVTVNLLWSFSSVVVAILGGIWLAERPTGFQWIGILLALLGAWAYFAPATFPTQQILGLTAAGVGILANAFAAILGRQINRAWRESPLAITVISMGSGSLVLLAIALRIESWPQLRLAHWAILLWLAIVNTAFAFTLWNHTLRTLTAVESSVINGTMLVWIPILAVFFLGESISGRELAGLAAVGIGTLIVQIKRIPKPFHKETSNEPATSQHSKPFG